MADGEANDLYRRVPCKPKTLCDLIEVEEALTTARLCIETFTKAIREREDHHARYFSLQLDDSESGHEERIEKLRLKQLAAEKGAAELQEWKAVLAEVEEQRRQAEETPVPDERHKMKAAPVMPVPVEAAPVMKAAPRIEDSDALPLIDQHLPVSQRKRSSAVVRPLGGTSMQTLGGKDKQAARVTEESCRIQATAPSAHSTTENQWDQGSAADVFQLADDQETQPLLSTSHRSYTDSSPSIPAPACSPPKLRTFVCIAYLATTSPGHPVRCAEVLAEICGSSRCQEHQDEYDEVFSALPTLEDEYHRMGQTIHDIPRHSEATRVQVTEDIATVTRYISLADRITAQKETLRRLDGDCSYDHAEMSIHSDTPDVYELLVRLKNTQSEFMHGPEPAPVVAVQPPPRYMQAAQATDGNQDTDSDQWQDSDPDRDADWDRDADSVRPTLTPQRRAEDGRRVGAAIAAMVEGVVAHFGCACLH